LYGRKRLTLEVRYVSSIQCSGGFLKVSRVSYMVGHCFRIPGWPKLDFSKTRATLNITFTPETTKLNLKPVTLSMNNNKFSQGADEWTMLNFSDHTFTEEHIPHSKQSWPRQCSSVDAQEPFSHVENRINLLFFLELMKRIIEWLLEIGTTSTAASWIEGLTKCL